MTIKPIKSERDYQKTLKEIEKLWDAKPNTAKGDRLECWLHLARRHTDSSLREIPQRLRPGDISTVSHGEKTDHDDLERQWPRSQRSKTLLNQTYSLIQDSQAALHSAVQLASPLRR
jgi:hypothetical protein